MNDIIHWRLIKGFPYEVSSDGRVRRLGHSTLTPRLHTNGYLRVSLGAKNDAYIHRLVCEAFHGEPPDRNSHADHINKIRNDNRAVNLRWLSPSENRATRSFRFGEGHVGCKLTESDIFEILWRSGTGEKDRTIAEDFNVSRRYVCDIRHRKDRDRFTSHD